MTRANCDGMMTGSERVKKQQLLCSVHGILRFVPTRSWPRKHYWLTGDRATDAWVIYLTELLLQHKLLQTAILDMIKKKKSHNTQSITSCCIWDSPVRVSMLTPVQHQKHLKWSVRTEPQSNGRRWCGLLSHILFSFYGLTSLSSVMFYLFLSTVHIALLFTLLPQLKQTPTLSVSGCVNPTK